MGGEPRWALFQISFRPHQEIEAKLGYERTIHSGPSFARLWYYYNIMPCNIYSHKFNIVLARHDIITSYGFIIGSNTSKAAGSTLDEVVSMT